MFIVRKTIKMFIVRKTIVMLIVSKEGSFRRPSYRIRTAGRMEHHITKPADGIPRQQLLQLLLQLVLGIKKLLSNPLFTLVFNNTEI